jgi:hypothetical protein
MWRSVDLVWTDVSENVSPPSSWQKIREWGSSVSGWLQSSGDTFLRNVGSHKIYTASYPTRQHSSSSPSWKQIFYKSVEVLVVLVVVVVVIVEWIRNWSSCIRLSYWRQSLISTFWMWQWESYTSRWRHCMHSLLCIKGHPTSLILQSHLGRQRGCWQGDTKLASTLDYKKKKKEK